MKCALLLLLPLMACSKPSPIRQVDCIVEESEAPTEKFRREVGSKLPERFVFNLNTGEQYQYDKFTEEFIPFEADRGAELGNSYKAALVNGKWKYQKRFKGLWPMGSFYVHDFVLDLNTLNFEDTFESSLFDGQTRAVGTCKLIQPQAPQNKSPTSVEPLQLR